jgi:hypothetical protein
MLPFIPILCKKPPKVLPTAMIDVHMGTVALEYPSDAWLTDFGELAYRVLEGKGVPSM